MPAGPGIIEYNDNLETAQDNLERVDTLLDNGVAKAQQVERLLETFAKIEDKADDIADTIASLETAVRLLEKVGPLKIVAKGLKRALDKMEETVRKVEKKADELDKKLEARGIKEKAKDAREKLEGYEASVELAALRLASHQDSAQLV
ncbi:MAG: hypothetical protein AAFY03_06055, partial [Pseudomonadota bacterium]